MAQSIRSKLASILRGESGNVAIITAIALVPLMMAGGAAVDYGNWVAVQARLQAATDAAALAAGREPNMSEDELKALATRYFKVNYGLPDNTSTPEVTFSIKENGNIRLDAKVTVENYLMKVIGIDSTDIATSAEVSRE